MDLIEPLRYRKHITYTDTEIVVFIDRDGTLTKEKGVINHPERLELEPTAIRAIGYLNKLQIPAIVLTNQPGVHRGIITEDILIKTHNKLIELLAKSGVYIDGIYVCPHISSGDGIETCICHKPETGLAIKAIKDFNLTPKKIYVVGDRATDIALANKLGGIGVLVNTGYGLGEWEYHQNSFLVKPHYIAEDIEDAIRWILMFEFSENNDVRKLPTPHYQWPVINSKFEQSVIKQLYSTISIRDKSGIIKDFEQEWCNYTNRKHAISYNSGTMALYAAYKSIGLAKGDEVIIPAYGFFATSSPLLTIGAVPVFVDVDYTGNIDPAKIEVKINRRTCAIVVSHNYGIPANMRKIFEIAQKHNLPIIEDASHSIGASQAEFKVGKIGSISVVSLQSNKLTPSGEGGILLTDNDELYIRATLQGNSKNRNLSDISEQCDFDQFHETGFGLKLRIHPLAAAIGLESLKQLGHVRRLRELCYCEMIEILKNTDGLSEIIPDYPMRISYYTLPMLLSPELAKRKDHIINELRVKGFNALFHHTTSGVIPYLPLFKNPKIGFPNYPSMKGHRAKEVFDIAANFNDRLVLLPLWHRTNDLPIAKRYAIALKDEINKEFKSMKLHLK